MVRLIFFLNFLVSVDASLSEMFEDARSEVESCQIKSQYSCSFNKSFEDLDKIEKKDELLDVDELELPPLESFFNDIQSFPLHPENVSLTADELENDLFPSTPLSEDQLRHADSVLQHELTRSLWGTDNWAPQGVKNRNFDRKRPRILILC